MSSTSKNTKRDGRTMIVILAFSYLILSSLLPDVLKETARIFKVPSDMLWIRDIGVVHFEYVRFVRVSARDRSPMSLYKNSCSMAECR